MGKLTTITATYTIAKALRSFKTHLQAGLKSSETIASYTKAVELMLDYFQEHGMPQAVDAVSREHIESFIAELGRRNSSATVVNRFKGLRAFWKWLEEEGEVTDSPMAKVHWPKLEEAETKAATKEEIKRLLAICDKSFKGRRDAALIMTMLDTGWRVNEVLAITVAMVDAGGKFSVKGKGRKVLVAQLHPVAQRYVDRYLRIRQSPRPDLFLSSLERPMTRNAVWEVLERRCKEAEIPHIKPHGLRHTHAIWWLTEGGNVMDLKANLGHSELRTTERYTKYMEQDRALEARKKFAPGNLL